MIFGLAVCGTLSAAGCSRTSDGTVVVKPPPSVTGYLPSWRSLRWTKRQEEPQVAAAWPAPPPPQQAAPAKRRAASTPLPFKVRPSGNMECRDVTQPGGRVRVVCN